MARVASNTTSLETLFKRQSTRLWLKKTGTDFIFSLWAVEEQNVFGKDQGAWELAATQVVFR